MKKKNTGIGFGIITGILNVLPMPAPRSFMKKIKTIKKIEVAQKTGRGK